MKLTLWRKGALFFLLISTTLSAQVPKLSSSAQISLYSCTPGKQIYSKFGHTAVRVCDPVNDYDMTFNYGMFSFYSDNFVLRFVRGETDYELGMEPTEYFLEEYAARCRPVYEQVLRLDSAQRNIVFAALQENYRPENRVYRYNFVFDNCATRPYELLVAALADTLYAPNFAKRSDTFRQIITHYTGANSWSQFGIDLVFGYDADRIMTAHERLFLPEELMNFLSEATLQQQPVLLRDGAHAFDIEPPYVWPLTPKCAMLVLLIFAILFSALDVWRGKFCYGFDAILYFVFGLISLIICYLWGFSEHPFVQHNLNVLFFNPLLLVLFVFTWFRRGRCWLNRIQPLLAVYFAVALLIYAFSPQANHMLAVAGGVSLLVRALTATFIAQGHKFRKPRKTALAMILLLGASGGVQAQTTPPRLVLVAVVDGLNMNSLDRMDNRMGQGGLQLLLNEGLCYENVFFPQMLNGGGEAVATLLTGAVPSEHGMVADNYYNKADRRIYPFLQDKTQVGIGTSETMSAAALLMPTVADELKIKTPESKVFAVGMDASETLLLAGHKANAAVWMDDAERTWVATSYYSEGLPHGADDMNVSGRFKALTSPQWRPSLPLTLYASLSDREKIDNGFAYYPFAVPEGQKHTCLKQTPAANDLVVELALTLQEQEQLGTGSQTDMLMVQLTACTPAAQGDFIKSAEQEDMYIRLNQSLDNLIDQLTKRIGKPQLLVAVVGKPAQGRPLEQLQQAKLPSGLFSAGRAAALINTYLMALYGHERWVDGGYGHQIYLNRTLLDQKGMNLADMQAKVADFLLEFEGVQAAYSASGLPLLMSDAPNSMVEKLRNSYNKRCGGDVLFTLQPGWTVSNEDGTPYDHVSDNNPTVPIFVWGGNFTPKRDAELRSATFFAPILCRFMQVPFSN